MKSDPTQALTNERHERFCQLVARGESYSEVSGISAHGTDRRDCITEDFWLI